MKYKEQKKKAEQEKGNEAQVDAWMVGVKVAQVFHNRSILPLLFTLQ